MSRTGGEETRARILAAAERLFAQGGFDATSVDSVARAARVNKALIYYHFEDKDDLILSVFRKILSEVEAQTRRAPAGKDGPRRALTEEIRFLAGRAGVLRVMLMEALKSRERAEYLFRLADLAVEAEHPAPPGQSAEERARSQVLEFFTGFLPLVMFVALRDSWSAHAGIDPDHAVSLLVDAYLATHMRANEPARRR